MKTTLFSCIALLSFTYLSAYSQTRPTQSPSFTLKVYNNVQYGYNFTASKQTVKYGTPKSITLTADQKATMYLMKGKKKVQRYTLMLIKKTGEVNCNYTVNFTVNGVASKPFCIIGKPVKANLYLFPQESNQNNKLSSSKAPCVSYMLQNNSQNSNFNYTRGNTC